MSERKHCKSLEGWVIVGILTGVIYVLTSNLCDRHTVQYRQEPTVNYNIQHPKTYNPSLP